MAEAGGGSTATADMAGLVRCSGRSPITTSMIMRSGEMASASGTTATPTFMPEYSRLTAMTNCGLLGAAPFRPKAGEGRAAGADVRRRQPQYCRPSDRSNPERRTADRSAIRRARRPRQRIDRRRPDHSCRVPGAGRIDGAGPACGHAAAHRGDDIRGRHRAAAAGKILWVVE